MECKNNGLYLVLRYNYLEWIDDVIYRANHEATLLIKLYISASTTELDVKQVKSGLELEAR
jgi:hypothetical protein